MSCALDGSRLMHINVSAIDSEHALIGAQEMGDDGSIGLRTTHEKVYVNVFASASRLDECYRLYAIGVLTIAHSLLHIGVGKALQDEGMSTLVIVTLELYHNTKVYL